MAVYLGAFLVVGACPGEYIKYMYYNCNITKPRLIKWISLTIDGTKLNNKFKYFNKGIDGYTSVNVTFKKSHYTNLTFVCP